LGLLGRAARRIEGVAPLGPAAPMRQNGSEQDFAKHKPMHSPDPARAAAPDARFLTLPGWQDSGPAHWQTRWEASYGDLRVVQDNWDWPLRGDWMARLDEVIGEIDPAVPVVLVAHSLACQLVAAWAAHSGKTARVRAALLVALPDVERPDMPPQLHSFRPIVRAALPFPALAVLSEDDPYGALARQQGMAADWGVQVRLAGARGHLNGDSGLGEWDEGRRWLAELLKGCLASA
jgi:predicted alpha/beta hydrolase family esterase